MAATVLRSSRLRCAHQAGSDATLIDLRLQRLGSGRPQDRGGEAVTRSAALPGLLLSPERRGAGRYVEKGERQLLLQGTEIGYAWALALDQTSGRFSASLTDLGGAFVLFGSCTPL